MKPNDDLDEDATREWARNTVLDLMMVILSMQFVLIGAGAILCFLGCALAALPLPLP